VKVLIEIKSFNKKDKKETFSISLNAIKPNNVKIRFKGGEKCNFLIYY